MLFETLPLSVIVKVPPLLPLIVTPLFLEVSIVQFVPLQPPPLIFLDILLLALAIVILPLETLSLIVVILALAQVAKKDIVAKDKKVFLVKERLLCVICLFKTNELKELVKDEVWFD
ncbi:hypothetical protein [Campylobacter armoricus]|uniref:hypothetical protein n=1 Tax=Campylobacter armoricus TaxID=2505970 RepID=UPI001116E671|nr:hypothetical protein [Campylobacter armoricus]